MSDDSSSPKPAPILSKKSFSPLHPLVAIAFVIVVYFLAQIVAASVINLYPALQHWGDRQTKEWLDSSLYAQFFFMLIAAAVAVGTLYQYLKTFGLSWKSIGFRRPQWMDLGMGLAIAPLYYLIYFVSIAVAGWLAPSLNLHQSQQLGFNPVGNEQLALTFIALVVIPPLMEETLMRGYLYTGLKRGLPQIYAAIVTSIIFASAHLQLGSGAPLLWVAAIDTFVLSLFLVWLREKTGSLWAGMVLHALKNSVAFLSLFIFHFT